MAGPSAAGVALLLTAMACLGGCRGGPAPLWRPAEDTLTWPLPPVPPRIRYQGAITAGQAVRFRRGFSLFDFLVGRPEIEWSRPHGVAVGPRTLVIADSGLGELHVFDTEARRYHVVREAGDKPLRCPTGVALDGRGGLFVADSALAEVLWLSTQGEVLGRLPGEFVRPAGVAYDAPRDVLYVVDAGAHRVLAFERRGETFALARTLGERSDAVGGFNFPTHAAVDNAGRLHVADSMNHRVQMFAPSGARLGHFGQAGDGTGDFAKAKGVAIDSEGHIYVVDSLYDVVQVFDRRGRLLLVFGGSGRGDGSLWLPTGICIDGKDRIYVADSGNSRIQVYQYLPQDADATR
jgi:DNA-binding beta-propeller fold protein YncE